VRVALERRRSASAELHLFHVVTPRTNAAAVTAAENLLAALVGAGPCALEIAANRGGRWFLARAASPATARHLAEQLAVAYPQAEITPLDVARNPSLDPARTAPGEQSRSCTLVLRGRGYLPLRTFTDLDVAAHPAAQADPVLGVLGALGSLPSGWRSLSQLVLAPAPEDWARDYLHLALDNPVVAERSSHRASNLASVLAMIGLLVVGTVLAQAVQLHREGDWPHLAMLATGLAAAAPLVWLARRLLRREPHDPVLVREKIGPIAYRAQLRLTVFAPTGTPAREFEARLSGLAAAYRQFNLASGNGLTVRPLRADSTDLAAPVPLGSLATVPILNVRELAGLWHLPQAGADASLVERTTARQRLPLPSTVARGCRIGVSRHQGREVPVALSDELLRRHLLLVAKTRRGKSTLLLRLARHLMEDGSQPPRALVLVDPHRDLAEAVLGCVPRRRWTDVVHLDVGATERPFGLNLLDVGLGWDRDKAVANALQVFRREFDRFWGPRMEDAFRFALLLAYDDNERLCREQPDGRQHQHTILEIATVLSDRAFRQSLLRHTNDPVIEAWWSGYFQRLDPKLQLEVSNPVQSKINRYLGSRAARAIVGQPVSTVDPAEWLRTGRIVVVNTNKGGVGEDTAALVGATLINLVGLVVGEQARLQPRERRTATILVDEFHTMPGADYEAILSELAKYGANLVLATQSLARLDALDREHQRALKATVFANLDGLFAFHTSAEDARYLVPELGDGVDVEDLASLGEHRCYARLSADRQRLPAFSVELDPPPPDDPERRDRLIAESAQRYGRDRLEAEADLRAAFERIARCGRPPPADPDAGPAGPEQPPAAGNGGGDPLTAADRTGRGRAGRRVRNQHRNQPDRQPGRSPGDDVAPEAAERE
jgi:hypothetical protein